MIIGGRLESSKRDRMMSALRPRKDETIQIRVSTEWLAKVDEYVTQMNQLFAETELRKTPLTRSDVIRVGAELLVAGGLDE